MGAQWKQKGREESALKRGQLFGKLAKEIVVAAKIGGADPHMNARLHAAVEAAKKQSVPFLVVGWVYEKFSGKTGMGGGDVKLLAMIGAFLGVSSLPFIIFISAALGTLVGLGLTLVGGAWRGGQWRTTRIPFGPFLAAAAFLYLFTGEVLLRYMRLIR